MWRDIALSTPRLWTTFHLDLENCRRDEHNVLSLLSLWLSLSKVLPISFTVSYQPSSRRQWRPSIAEHVLNALALHMDRWQSVHLMLPGAMLRSMLDTPQHDCSFLQELDLDLKGPCHFDVRSLCRSQLTTLNLWLEYDALLSLDQWAILLSEATALMHCKFNAKCVWGQQSEGLEVVLVNLQNLDVVFQADTDVANPETALSTFLSHLNLPILKECRLAWQVRSSGDVESGILHASLIGLLAEIKPSLKVLSLAYFPLQEVELIDCLATVPCLTAINLQYSLGNSAQSPLSDATLRALTLPTNQSPPQPRGLLPRLQSIQMQCRRDAFSDSALGDLIKSRKGSHLHDVSCLMLKSPRADDMLPQRREWEKDGIQVSLQFIEV